MPLFESCMFCTESRLQQRTKGNKSGYILKDTDNKSVSAASFYQIHSAQTVLVLQFLGKLKSARIWSVQVLVDHFSDLTYINLIRSTSQEVNVTGKSPFKILADIFGFKVHIYHAENGRLYGKPFKSEIEGSNQTITFCGVESHNQNFIVERKIHGLTLGAITFRIHAKKFQRQ